MQNLEQKYLKGYKLEERIGTGGFGAVYRAKQTSIDREVAIKIILPSFANNPDFIRRFESEAQTIARLEHPHIVPLIDYWRDPEGAYLVMRYLRGGSVRQALADGPYELIAISQLLDQLASAMDFSHRNNVIHRDIKPGNILLDEDGNAYLSDFGIAKDLAGTKGNKTGVDVVVGSLDYISPEQARSEPVTPRTDIYSLGVTLFEMITGEHPFKEASSVERLYKHINDPLPEITTLSNGVCDEINEIIQKATAKDPDKRYPDVLTLAIAFREAVGRDTPQEFNIVEQLTLREQEILALIARGMSNREIANELVVTIGTIKWHIRHLYGKLGVRNRVQAIVRGRELDLIVTGDELSMPDKSIVSVSLPEPENPYKGLHAFQIADAHDFFGREELTHKLIDCLQDNHPDHRFLAVIGPSGSGKSSLVRAGLIPALWRGALPGSEKWFVVDMIPGSYPIDKLETALVRVTSNQAHNLHDQLQRDDRGLLRVADIILPNDDTELVIIVDQFEEVFTLVENEKERQHFLDLLRQAVTAPHSRVRVVITLRADYYDRPLLYPEFGHMIRSRMETILPLSAQGLERAIRGPAERVGVTFEQGLVEQIVSEMNYQAGALPLLQYALTELFDRREGRLLTHSAYQEIGGAVGALAHRADEIYEGLTSEGQELAHQMFMRLVTLGEGAEDSRRRATQAELLSLTQNTDLMEEVIDQFAAYRLLSLDHDPETRQPTVEVAHEAILREWEQLREWINHSRTALQLQRQLAGLVEDWRKAEKHHDYLLHGARLGQFEAWSETTSLLLTPAEEQFLKASIAARISREAKEQARRDREIALEKRSQQRMRYLVAVLTLMLVGTVAFSVFALDRENEARVARDDAQLERDRARDLALVNGARVALANWDVDTALALAFAANQTEQPSGAAQAALAQIAYIPGTVALLAEGMAAPQLDVSSDGRLAMVGDAGKGEVTIWDMENRQPLYTTRAHEAGIIDVGISPDGKLGFSTAGDLQIVLWDMESGEILHRLGEDEMQSGFFSATFTPDSKQLLSTNGGRPGRFEGETADLILWDVETGTVVDVLAGHTQMATKVAISPDGRIAISGGGHGEWVSWDMESGQMIRRVGGDVDDAWAFPSDIVFRPDGRTVLALYTNMTAALLDVETLETLQTYGEDGPNWEWSNLVVSPDGQTIFFRNDLQGKPAFWDVESGNRTATLLEDFAMFGAGALPGYEHIMVGRLSEIRLQATGHGAEDMVIPTELPPWWMELSPDGESLLISTGVPHFDGATDCAFVLVEAATGAVIRQFGKGSPVINDVDCASLSAFNFYVFSPDSRQVLTGARDGHAALWDIETGEVLLRLEGHSAHIRGVAISPDGQIAVTGACQVPEENNLCPESEMILWDLTTGQEIRRFASPADSGHIGRMEFSPDGQTILAVNTQVAIYWDVTTGEIIREFKPPKGSVRDITISPDGQTALIASADSGTLSLWDLTTGQQLHVMETGMVSGAKYTPDGRFALTSGQQVGIWDLTTGQEIRRYTTDQNFWTAPTIDANGQGFFVFDTAALVFRHWRIDWDDSLLDWVTENRYVRDLTCTEREIYQLAPLCEV